MIGAIADIGSLDRLATIQKHVQEVGEIYGEPTEAWVDWATVRANVKQLSGREFFEARQLSAEVNTIIKIRYKRGISATMRIVCEGMVYDIYHIAEIGRKVGLNILARARQL